MKQKSTTKKGMNNLTLKNVCEKPLAEILKEMSIVDVKIHNNDYGEIFNIEVKYASQDKQILPIQNQRSLKCPKY